ncbi:MAG: CapA family protein [Rhizobiaceae bacterium]
MANFPAWYIMSWLPRLLWPSVSGDRIGLSPAAGCMPGVSGDRIVRLVFLGDLSAVMNRRPPVVDAALRDRIAAADLVVANCESPVVERPHHPLLTRIRGLHAMKPSLLRQALSAAGIRPDRLVLSLANNHALDQGVSGLEETVAALGELGATIAGLVAAPPPLVSVGGISISFDAFTIWRNAPARPFAKVIAMDPRPAARPPADLVCVLPHWDREFRHVPADWTRTLAKRLVGDGAGLVVGGHPHVPQPVEVFGGALVAYALGDFLGTAWFRIRWPLRIAAMIEVDVSAGPESRGRIASWTIVPFYRLPDGDRERLVPIGGLPDTIGDRVAKRVEAIFATQPPSSSP